MVSNFKKQALIFVIILMGLSFSVSAQSETERAHADTASVSPVLESPVSQMSDGFQPMLFRTVLSLLLVVGVVYAGAWFLKRFVRQRGGGAGFPVRVLGSTLLGPKRSLYLVEVEGRRLVLGVTDASINLITELEKGDESEIPRQSEKPAGEFGNLLGSLLKKGKS